MVTPASATLNVGQGLNSENGKNRNHTSRKSVTAPWTIRSVRFPAAPPSNRANPAALTLLESRLATSNHAINPIIRSEPAIRITRVNMLEPFEKELNAMPGFFERMMLNQLGITTCGKYESGRDSIHAFVARSNRTTNRVSQSHRIRPGIIMSSRKRKVA